MTTQTLPVLANGRYHVLARLGEGGMGIVYKARDTNLDADVVIKMPRRNALNEPGFAERFKREIRSLVKLAHPHIVKISDFGDHEDVPFAVLQYLSGGSLQDRRPRNAGGYVLPAEAVALSCWLDTVAGALDFVHQQGYLHRDVKPGNILFDAQGNAYLSDFGVAKVLSGTTGNQGTPLTAAGLVLGTPEYMAPELIMGSTCDGRADQYALGVTVYEVLAGRPPFVGANPAAILVMQTTQPLDSLAQVNPRIAPALASAVERALAKDPVQRYPNCRALARAILGAITPGTAAGRTRATAGIPTLPPPPVPPQPPGAPAAATVPFPAPGAAPPPRLPAVSRVLGTLSPSPPLPGGKKPVLPPLPPVPRQDRGRGARGAGRQDNPPPRAPRPAPPAPGPLARPGGVPPWTWWVGGATVVLLAGMIGLVALLNGSEPAVANQPALKLEAGQDRLSLVPGALPQVVEVRVQRLNCGNHALAVRLKPRDMLDGVTVRSNVMDLPAGQSSFTLEAHAEAKALPGSTTVMVEVTVVELNVRQTLELNLEVENAQSQ
jgi:serine/threonine protein kinase